MSTSHLPVPARNADSAFSDAVVGPLRAPNWIIDAQRAFHIAVAAILGVTVLTVAPPTLPFSPFNDEPMGGLDTTDFDGAALAAGALFEPNGGRFDPVFDYALRGGDTSVAVGPGRMAIALSDDTSTSVATMSFVGADTSVAPTISAVGAAVNYILGSDPAAWQTGLSTAGAIEYTDVIGSSDVRFLAVDEGFRFDIQVEPRTDPASVMIDVDGAELQLLSNGDLELELPGGRSTTYSAPIAFQDIDGTRQLVEASFGLVDSDTIGFTIGDYDTTQPLVIDPTLDFSTYVGGGANDVVHDVAVDASNDIYMVGNSNSSDFPTTTGTYSETSSGNHDAVVSKYSEDGTTLVWSTYIGGANSDIGYSLALASDGDLVVAGETESGDFPTTVGAHDRILDGSADAFVLELSADGTTLEASTYVGGTEADGARSVAVAADGAVIIGATTDSVSYPTTGGAYDTIKAGVGTDVDAAVTSLDPLLTSLNWSTFIGGTGNEELHDIDVDSSGDVYVALGTFDGTLATTAGAFDTSYNGSGDAWIGRLADDGSTLEYATFLGGTGDDTPAAALRVEAPDRVHVGSVATAGFPTSANAWEPTNNTTDDTAYVVLDPTATGATQLHYATFLGGTGAGLAEDIEVDSTGRGYLVGDVGEDGLATSNASTTGLVGVFAAFLAVFDPDSGTRDLFTYVGGTGYDIASGVALDGLGRPVVGGLTTSTDLPTSVGAHDSTFDGSIDGFLTRFGPVAASDPGPAPLVEFNLDENTGTATSDAQGRVADGTLAGGATWTPGVSGAAIDVSSATARVSIPSDADLNPSTATHAISVWYRQDADVPLDTAATIYRRTEAPGGVEVGYHLSVVDVAGVESLTVSLNNDTWSTPAPTDGEWHHVVISTPSTQRHLYLDGALAATLAGGASSATLTAPLYLGATDASGTDPFNGAIDEWSFFSDPLTAAQVATLYERDKPAATVNDTGDAVDLTPGDGVCDTGASNADGDDACTLRAAIDEANASADIDTIRFDIPKTDASHTAGVWTISPASDLPALSSGTDLDATTQSGWAGTPTIELDGTSTATTGIELSSGTSMIRGLSIHSFIGDGVVVSGGTGHTVAGNWVGLEPDGTTASGNGDEGIQVTSDGNTIGGSSASNRNIVSGNDGNGLLVRLADDNVVTGNWVGTDETGLLASGNSGEGIELFQSLRTQVSDNLVADSGFDGIELLDADNSIVTGNIVGVGADGATPLGNVRNGISVEDGTQDTTVGGTGAGDGNTVRFNSQDGVAVEDLTTDDVAILGNSIRANNAFGIHVDGPTTEVNRPTMTAPGSGDTTIDVTLNAPAGSYRVEVFDNPTNGADSSGFGEGESLIHAETIAHTGTGVESFTLTSVPALTSGDVLSATVTEDLGGGSFGSTSEFSTVVTALPSSSDPVVLDRIQSGTVTLADTQSSVTATIDAVDGARSMLTFTVRGDDDSPDDLWVTGVLTNATTITFERIGNVGDMVIEWSVTEFRSGVTVQRGVSSLSSTTTDVALSPIDLTKSFPLISHRAAGATFGVNDFVRAELTSSTNMRLTVGGISSNVVPWQVVTYNDATVQRGTVGLGTGTATGATGLGTAVDLDKAWLIYSITSDGGTASDIGQKLIRGRLTDPSTITFDRSNTGQLVSISWFVVEFTDGTEVQHSSAAFGVSDTTVDVTIDPVDRSRSIASGGYLGYGGRSAYAADDNAAEGWFTTTLTSATNLRVQRDAALATADLGWFVIHWVCADSDSDGVTDCSEDADTDLDNDPTTNPGPDTDGDTNANYDDADDDGDGIATSAENADPNADGSPRDALDSDRDGQPDYLDRPTAMTASTVVDEQRISATQGGLTGPVLGGDSFGQSVAAIGDLDRDGIVDMIVGADGTDDVNATSGAVHIVFLNADGTVRDEQKISNTAGDLSASLQFGDRFGSGVAGLGDVDGDGIPDVAVGAFGTDDAGSNTGAIYVLMLHADGTVKTEQKISNTAGGLSTTLGGADRFGSSVGSIGDLDGDGIPDVAVGAVWDDDGVTDAGAVYVLFLNADGTVKAEQKMSNTAGGLSPVLAAFDYFGSAVSGIGDIDGDGVPDIGVGAYTSDDGASAAGSAYVLLMNSNGTVKAQQELSNTEGGLAATLQLGDYFGISIAGVGDLDLDGIPDIAVGAHGTDDGGTDRGATYVLLLNSNGTIKAEQQISGSVGGLSTAPSNGDQFGASVTGLGDLDGDGTIGIAIGARYADDGGSLAGAVYVLDLEIDSFSVNSTGDDGDAIPGDNVCDTGGTNSAGAPECTLRAAIEEANAVPVPSAIHFDLPVTEPGHVSGSWTLAPASAYDAITEPTTIDASTQPGWTATPVVSMDGTLVPAAVGLDITADDVVIRGLQIGRFDQGVVTTGARTVLEANHIGINAAGNFGARNHTHGVRISGPDAVIDGNNISYNGSAGILVESGGDRARIVNNDIGIRADATFWEPNRQGGIQVDGADDVTIGEPGSGNVISGNEDAGIIVLGAASTGGVVQANLIGVGPNGTTPMPNAGGIAFRNPSAGWLIGGTGPDEGNLIAHNTATGISFRSDLGTANDVTIVGNSIHSNIGLAIDLTPVSVATDGDGVTTNDPGDIDAGTNDLLNFPEIAATDEVGGTVSLDVTLDVPAGNYRIEVFANPTGYDPTGYGEGEQFVHAFTVTHTGSGVESFSTTVAGVSGDTLTLTTTEDLGAGNYGSTSEFSAASTVCSDPDGDGICSHFEDLYGDTDGDTVLNSLDADDDGDGILTANENADPNADGDPRDALDTDRDGQPDYLDIPSATASPEVATLQKISDAEGGFTTSLDDGDHFGRSVASIGDVDGDGTADLAVGAWYDDDDGNQAGAVYILFLNTNGTVRAEHKINESSGDIDDLVGSDFFGRSVAGIGDLDGDGVSDIAVGATGDNLDGVDRGAIYVLLLNSDGSVKAEQRIGDTDGGFGGALDDNDEFGTAIGGLGDLDGDGINDITIGAPGDDDGGTDAGAVYVLFLNDDGTVENDHKIVPSALITTVDAGDEFGGAVALLGDVNGDGVGDIAVGAPKDGGGATSGGAVHIVLLNDDGTVAGGQELNEGVGGFPFEIDIVDLFGDSVTGVGDLDGNGTPDVAIGARGDDDGGSSHGAVYIAYLGPTGSAVDVGKIFDGTAPLLGEIDGYDSFGSAIASVGDLDGDGSPGLAVGALFDDDSDVDNGGNARGAVYMLELVTAHTVNSTGDAADLSLSDGVCDTGANNTDGDPECTLRAAIAQANASTDRADIHFDIPTSDSGHTAGVWRIEPATLLPSITTTISIDASTQPGYTTSPVIELYGNGGAGDGFGLSGTSNSVTIRGFAMGGFASNDIQVFGDDHLIVGNYFGVTADGVTEFAIGSGGASLLLQAGNGTTIGGNTSADRNVIINATWGIVVNGSIGSSNVTINGNYIGLDATGNTVAATATATGIGAYSGATSVVIGGATPASGNVIAASSRAITIDGENTDGVVVANNSIGIGADGTAATNAGFAGIDVTSGADGTVIDDNMIGNASGALIRVNAASTGTTITSNLLGTDASGNSHPVTGAGIELSGGATNSTIGGADPTDGNSITNATGDGIVILSGLHSVLSNSIFGNGGLGIDIDDDGVSLPDAGDVDGVPNQPTLLGAVESAGTTSVDLVFDAPIGAYLIQYFDNPSGADASGFGEGEQLVASVPVTITDPGAVVLRHVVPGTALTISATATNTASESTSEFSNAIDGATAEALRIDDASVRRSDLTAFGGTPAFATGAAGEAVSFDGTDDMLIGPALNVTDNALTLGASVFIDVLAGTDTVLSKHAADGDVIYELSVDGATGEAVGVIDVTGTPIEVRGGTVTAATWHRLDAVWNGATFVLYVDGVSVDSAPAVGTLRTDVSTRMSIGARHDGTLRLDGRIDNIQVRHDAVGVERVAAHQENLDGGLLTIGAEQTGAAGAWTASGTESRSGGFSMSAPETIDSGAAAWAVATGIDEPGIVFESWWWLSQASDLDVAAGTRATNRPVDQYSAAAVDSPSAWEIRQPLGDTTTVDATNTATIDTGQWVHVEIWTDQLNNTRLVVDGMEIIGWTAQGGALTTGSAGLAVHRLPNGEAWYVDDARTRKLVTPEPATTLGTLQRQ
ncbi:MAG: LamG-like jellyroll fold domain-containing protein [Ilumatobacter sp.]